MPREEYDRLGHITETGNCFICGKEYTDYGNSTWGIWTAEEEKMVYTEKYFFPERHIKGKNIKGSGKT